MYIHYNDDTCIERGPQMVDCNHVWFHIRYTLSVNVFTTGQWLHYKRDQYTYATVTFMAVVVDSLGVATSSLVLYVVRVRFSPLCVYAQ